MRSNNTIIIVVLTVAVGILAFIVYERRSPMEKAGDSLREAGRDIQDAVNPRSLGEKIGDGIRDTVRDSKN